MRNGSIKNVLGCQNISGRTEAFHGSAASVLNFRQYTCIDSIDH